MSFNGAATLSLRKLIIRRPANRFSIRFNGAATLSLRKRTIANYTRYRYSLLQWGRNFIVAETQGEIGYRAQADYASMGPQLYRCGNMEHGSVILVNMPASMGPQLYRCGNDAITRYNIGDPNGLQWGRNFIVAETGRPIVSGETAITLQWGRNFIVAETCNRVQRRVETRRCFNGAATLSLRKQDDGTGSDHAIRTLQWGRNFIVAETRICSYQDPRSW